jgi:hypothetical protein
MPLMPKKPNVLMKHFQNVTSGHLIVNCTTARTVDGQIKKGQKRKTNKSKFKKNQQKIATEQIKTATTRSKLIAFKTRGTQNKALTMKNRKTKCLNHLTALTISNLKCHIIYFSRGFQTINKNQGRECFKILPTQSMILC